MIMKWFVTILLLSTTMTSCISYYDISVRKDGSASVKAASILVNDIERYYHSEIITNIDTSAGQLNFEIKDIDSLGYYLPLLQPGFIQFRKDSNLLTVLDRQTIKALTIDDGAIARISLSLNFDQEINLKSSIGKQGKNRVYITKSRRRLLKSNKQMEAVIELIPVE